MSNPFDAFRDDAGNDPAAGRANPGPAPLEPVDVPADVLATPAAEPVVAALDEYAKRRATWDAAVEALDAEVTKHATAKAEVRAFVAAQATATKALPVRIPLPPSETEHAVRVEVLSKRILLAQQAATAAAQAADDATLTHLGEALARRAAVAQAVKIAKVDALLSEVLDTLAGVEDTRSGLMLARHGQAVAEARRLGCSGNPHLPISQDVVNRTVNGRNEHAVETIRDYLWRLTKEREAITGPIGWDNVAPSAEVIRSLRVAPRPLLPALPAEAAEVQS